jgi:PTS system mannose-specific IIC component
MAGEPVVNLIKERLPMDGIPMKTLFTVGSLLPCVGIAILLKQIVRNVLDFIPYLTGFTLAASMGINLVASTVIAGMFAIVIYKLKMLELRKPAAASSSAASENGWDDDEEDI